MDYQPQPQFEESALKESCSADCSSCPTFPAPFRRIGDSTYCRFSQLTFAAGEGVTFPADRMVRILFVMSGSLRLEHGNDTVRLVTSKQCVCLARSERFVVTAQDDETHVVVLSLIHRIEFCEQDIFDKVMPYDSVVPTESVPMLSMHPAIERLLSTFFTIRQMFNCVRYHRMKATELFMMIKVLYTPTEHAYFFQSMIQPQDNFRVFVCNNYDKAQGVAELASLAGMSLSVFKRRFAEHFNDSVYHWMMRQKALKVFTDIRDGGQHQGADEQVRVPSLHAVQSFLQELPSGDARAADQLDQEEIGPPAATDKKDEKEASPQVSFFRCDAG